MKLQNGITFVFFGGVIALTDKSAAVPGLNRNDAYEKKITLPPLAEQKRIDCCNCTKSRQATTHPTLRPTT